MSQENFSVPYKESDEELSEEMQEAVNQAVEFCENLPEDPDEERQNRMIEKMDSLSESIEKFSSIAAEIRKQMEDTFSARLETCQKELETEIQRISEKQESNDRKLSQTLRENANFQIHLTRKKPVIHVH